MFLRHKRLSLAVTRPVSVAIQVVSTVDPFGYYVAEIQEGLNDAFAEKAGSGDDAVDEDSAEKSRKAKAPTVPSTPAMTAATPQTEGGQTPTNGSPAAPPAQPGNTAPSSLPEVAEAAPPADHGDGDLSEVPVIAVALPPAITAVGGGGVTSEAPSGAASPGVSHGTALKAAATDTVLQKDAFLVFRALCKLSIRTADASSGTDLTAIRGKVSFCDLTQS